MHFFYRGRPFLWIWRAEKPRYRSKHPVEATQELRPKRESHRTVLPARRHPIRALPVLRARGCVARLFGTNKRLGVLMAATIGVPLYVCGGGVHDHRACHEDHEPRGGQDRAGRPEVHDVLAVRGCVCACGRAADRQRDDEMLTGYAPREVLSAACCELGHPPCPAPTAGASTPFARLMPPDSLVSGHWAVLQQAASPLGGTVVSPCSHSPPLLSPPKRACPTIPATTSLAVGCPTAVSGHGPTLISEPAAFKPPANASSCGVLQKGHLTEGVCNPSPPHVRRLCSTARQQGTFAYERSTK